MHRDATYEDAARPEAADTTFVMDEEAFRAFYDRTARGVWAYLWRVTGDRSAADDLLQESYFRLLRGTAEHDSEPHRRNALYRIATNLARDRWRRLAARPVAELSGEEAAPAADVEGRTDFKRAMAKLNPRERAMLWLAYAEGASHEEIAGVLGVKVASMKVLLFRARRRLAELLGRR